MCRKPTSDLRSGGPRRWQLCLAAILAVALPSALRAGTQTQVNFDSGTQAVYNLGGTLLSPGSAADGDGAVIQLGYYDGASAGDVFAGTWHALTGQGSLNTGGNTGSGLTFNTTSIGDIGGGAAPEGAGVFAFSLVFENTVAGSFNDLPTSATIPLAIKFYNGTSIANSTYFNVVSSSSWLWKSPTLPSPLPPVINLSLDDVGLQWQSIVMFGQSGSTAFHTSIAVVPEPTTYLSAMPCVVALLLRRPRNFRRSPSAVR